MDVTDIPSVTVHSDSDENRHEKLQTSQSIHSQYASEYCNNPLAKREVQTTRPCAIIGPDRIIQQQPKRHSVLWPPTQDETTYFSVPQSYHHYSAEHLYPPRNISPRQTFQENMPRILVPSGSSSKIPSEAVSQVTAPGSFSDEGNVYIPKHFNPSLPIPKYCDMPYVVNQVNEHRPHATKIGDLYVTKGDTLPSMMAPVPPHHNLSARNWQQVPIPQYQGNYTAPSLHRYADYQHCPPPMYRPVKQCYKKVNDETSPTYIGEGIYKNSDLRFQPYPTGKDKYGQARYDYQYNISNQYLPNYTTSQRSDYPKTVMRQPVQYPQHLHNQAVEPSADCLHKISATRHPSQPTHHSVPYQMNENITVKHIPGEHMYPVQSKVYGYSGDSSSRYVNSIKGFENSKIYLDYNQRVKNIAYSDPFVSDPTLASYHKTQTPFHNYSGVNSNGQRAFPSFNVNYKMFETLGNSRHLPEYNIPYKTQDLRHNTYNPLARIPAQFSPNIISPTDSNTSVESTQQTQEDCGYVSQCSTTSGKSTEYPHKFYSNCDRKGNRLIDGKLLVPPTLYNMSPTNRPAPDYSHQHSYHTNHTSTEQNKQYKQVRDLRQFLQMYNPHEEFEEATPNQEPSNCDKLKVDNLVSGNLTAASSGQNQLYVLGLVNVSSEELQKYEHIQKVNKLPDNIKGYNNVELLNQFEEATGISESRETFESDKLPNISAITDNKGNNIISHNTLNYNCTRPISPLDVEAKISQSIIHKEVGCNFEIKPCSPVQTPNLPIVSNVAKFEDVPGSDIFSNTYNPKDTTPEECTEVHIDIKSKLREKRRAKTGITHAPSKRLKNENLHDYDTNEGIILNPYKSNDSDHIQPKCQSSLPQLDSDIDIVGNMTTQNKNDAMKDCSGATYLEGHTNIQYNDGQLNQNIIYANTDQNELINSKEILNPPANVSNDSPIASPLNSVKIDEKSSSKLSKYRKVKKIDSPLPEMLMPSSNTIDYCSNSPLNLELAPEIRESNDRFNEVALNQNSSEPHLHGLVNSVINSITDGKIESVTYRNTYNSGNLYNQNHNFLKNNDSLQPSHAEGIGHGGLSLESSSSQKKEPYNTKIIESGNFSKQFISSNIQYIDEKLCGVQLKDNNNFISSDYESKSSIDAFNHSFTAANLDQTNVGAQSNKFKKLVYPETNITTCDKIENDVIQKKIQVITKEEIKSTPEDIKNIVIRNDVIKNDFTKEAKDNCEDSLIGEYNDRLSPNPTELTTLIDLSVHQELSQPEEQDLKKYKDNSPETQKINKTIISVENHHRAVVKNTTETCETILSIDTQSKNISDLKIPKITKDIESNTLIEAIKTNDTFLSNSTETACLINSHVNPEISQCEKHNLEILKDKPIDDELEETLISEKNHHKVLVSLKSVTDKSVKSLNIESECKNIYDHLNTSEKNESKSLYEVANTKLNINSASRTIDTPKSEELSLLDVNHEKLHSKENDFNVLDDLGCNIHKTIISEEILVGSIDKSENVLSINSECEKISNLKHLNETEYTVGNTEMKDVDTDINSVCDTNNTHLPKSKEPTLLFDLPVNQEIIYSKKQGLDISKDNPNNSHNIMKPIICEVNPQTAVVPFNSTTVTSKKIPNTEYECILRLENSDASGIERNTLIEVVNTKINSVFETNQKILPQFKKLSPLDLPFNQELTSFIEKDISKNNLCDVVTIERTMIPKEIPSKSMTYKSEESEEKVSTESKSLISVADTDMNPVCETGDTLSPKREDLTPLLDSPVNNEIFQSEEKDLNISKDNFNLNSDTDRSNFKSMSETSQKILSTKLECKNNLGLDNLNSTNTQMEVADTEIDLVGEKDHPFSLKSPVNQDISHFEEKDFEFSEDHSKSNENIEKTMISNAISQEFLFTLRSMSDRSEKSHWEHLNVTEAFQSTKLKIADADMNSVGEKDYKLSQKSEELSPLSTVNQEISYLKEENSTNISNNSENIFNINTKENNHGGPICLKNTTYINNPHLEHEKVSEVIESDTLMEVCDTEINVYEMDQKCSECKQKSSLLHDCNNKQYNSYSTGNKNDIDKKEESFVDLALLLNEKKYSGDATIILNSASDQSDHKSIIKQSEESLTKNFIESKKSKTLLYDSNAEKTSKPTDDKNLTKDYPLICNKNDVRKSTKSVENNFAALELNLIHNDFFVSMDLYSKADKQIYVKHSNITPILVKNYDSPISEYLNAEIVEGALHDSSISEVSNGDIVESALDDSTTKVFNVHEVESTPEDSPISNADKVESTLNNALISEDSNADKVESEINDAPISEDLNADKAESALDDIPISEVLNADKIESTLDASPISAVSNAVYVESKLDDAQTLKDSNAEKAESTLDHTPISDVLNADKTEYTLDDSLNSEVSKADKVKSTLDDSLISENSIADKAKSIQETIEDNTEHSLLENNHDTILREINYEKVEKVNIAIKDTIENNNCEERILFKTNNTQKKYEKDANISLEVSCTSGETIDLNVNSYSSDSVLLEKFNYPKSKAVNNDGGEELSIGIILTSYETTIHESCDKIKDTDLVEKKSFLSTELNFVKDEINSRELNCKVVQNNFRNIAETINCNNLLPVLVKNGDSLISNEFNYEKGQIIDGQVNLTSNKTTKNCSKYHTNLVEKKIISTLSELNYDKGENIKVSKVYTECDDLDNSETRKVEKFNSLSTPKELNDELAENVSVEEKSNETIQNIRWDIQMPVLVENYDSPMSENLDYKKYQDYGTLNNDESGNTTVGEIIISDPTLVEKYNSQILTNITPDDGENISIGVKIISEGINENNNFNTELVLVENYDSPISNYNSDVNESKEMIKNNNCEIRKQMYNCQMSNSEIYDSDSIEISDNMTSKKNEIQENSAENADFNNGNDEVAGAEDFLPMNNAVASAHPPDEENINNDDRNVDEILEQDTQVQDSDSSSQFYSENNKYDVNHTDDMILAQNMHNDLQLLEVGSNHIKTQNEDVAAPRDASMFLGYDSEDFMSAGVITVKDEQCCVVLERNGKIYSERGNSIEDVLCNMIPCSPLSDTDEQTQDYELVSCESYDNIPNDGVTESIDNFSGVDIQISSSEGDENANNITLQHKVTLCREASTCESDSEESSLCNIDSRDPCLQGVDDSPVLLELPSVMNENHFCESSNFENTNIGIQYEDCWINDVACIETVVSEDVSGMTQDERLDLDECSNGSKEQDRELQPIEHDENSVLLAGVIEKEVKSLYVRIKLVSQIETENFNKTDSCFSIKDRRPMLLDRTDDTEDEISVKEKDANIERDEVINDKNLTPSANEQKCLEASKYCSIYKGDEADINVENDDNALNCNNFTAEIAEKPAARGRVVSNVSYNYNTDSTHSGSKLITKAAKKYIPPIVDSQHNFKVQLPLSKEKLLRLKIMKLKFDEATAKPKMRWQASFSQAASTSLVRTPINTTTPKKSKPKFEDVLKKIDHIQINSFSKPKKKKEDLDPSVPKVVIKKNEYGSHYTANIKKRRARSPDLTGRRWQPWVNLERNRLIEKMVSKKKFCAVFCHSSNRYIIPRRERRESKDSRRDPEIVVSRPLKCTIKFNTDNRHAHAVLAPAYGSAHTSHSSLHHSKPILTISSYSKKNKNKKTI